MSLTVEDLVIEIDGRRVVDGVSLQVPDGTRLGVIGESGSGKSLTALAVLGLLPEGATARGSIRWDGTELIGMPDRELARLRGRYLNHKRSLAIREYVLGLEALDRLAEGEPLWRVHEAVFGVLALESEPVDPRL